MVQYKRLAVNLPLDVANKLDFILTARNCTRTDLIINFINTQYELLAENSPLHQTITEMEQLSKKLEELTKTLPK